MPTNSSLLAGEEGEVVSAVLFGEEELVTVEEGVFVDSWPRERRVSLGENTCVRTCKLYLHITMLYLYVRIQFVYVYVYATGMYAPTVLVPAEYSGNEFVHAACDVCQFVQVRTYRDFKSWRYR